MTKERIVKVLKNLKFTTTHYEVPVEVIQDAQFDAAADQILLLMQPKDNVQPQLQQHDVSGRSEQLPCEHLPMIDTGVGYYHCPACGWSEKVDGNCH